jgi:serine protease Do
MRRLVILITILVVLLGVISAAEKYIPSLSRYISSNSKISLPQQQDSIKIVKEESTTISIVKKVGPAVVTVSEIAAQQGSQGSRSFGFGPFSFFDIPQDTVPPTQNQPQDIGSGFIISQDGLIVTNKHVVSDTQGKYQIITSDDKKYDVQKVYRDPLNDVALLKVDPSQNSGQKLTTVTLGESSKLEVGQYVAAIGTALGEFRNTVTTGIISGLGRGITAGSPYEGSVERLDNVIQTDAAINPGNSGGPLLNSIGQVIGVNTAVSQSGQNIGFAIPINVIKDSLNNFNKTGKFDRPYLGISYKMISKDVAILNNVAEGAYVQQVIQDSPADKAGIQDGDILVSIDGERINSKTQVSTLISKKKVGDTITITLFRDDKTIDLQATLDNAPEQ